MSVIDVIDTLINEHDSGNVRTASLQVLANMTVVIRDIETVDEWFAPGRLDQQRQLDNLEKLMLFTIDFLNRHFQHEETVLLQCVEQYCDWNTVITYNRFLNEHEYLKTRIGRVLELIRDLKSGKLSVQHWNSSANDMKAYLSHTCKLLQDHASAETAFYLEIKEQLLMHPADQKEAVLTKNDPVTVQ